RKCEVNLPPRPGLPEGLRHRPAGGREHPLTMPAAVEPANEAKVPVTDSPAISKVPAKAVAMEAWMVAPVAVESVVARIPGPIEAKRRVVGIGIARIRINRIG